MSMPVGGDPGTPFGDLRALLAGAPGEVAWGELCVQCEAIARDDLARFSGTILPYVCDVLDARWPDALRHAPPVWLKRSNAPVERALLQMPRAVMLDPELICAIEEGVAHMQVLRVIEAIAWSPDPGALLRVLEPHRAVLHTLTVRSRCAEPTKALCRALLCWAHIRTLSVHAAAFSLQLRPHPLRLPSQRVEIDRAHARRLLAAMYAQTPATGRRLMHEAQAEETAEGLLLRLDGATWWTNPHHTTWAQDMVRRLRISVMAQAPHAGLLCTACAGG